MVAQRIPTIMPPMTKKEIIEVSKIYKVCALLPNGQTLITRRPFRNPHHTTSFSSGIGRRRSASEARRIFRWHQREFCFL